jgi:transposase-like protein
VQLGVSAAQHFAKWVSRDQGPIEAKTTPTDNFTPRAAEAHEAKKRIRQLRAEVEILKIAMKSSSREERIVPAQRIHPVV